MRLRKIPYLGFYNKLFQKDETNTKANYRETKKELLEIKVFIGTNSDFLIFMPAYSIFAEFIAWI